MKTPNEKYLIAVSEISRHEEDANYNRLAHFAIAKKYRKRYTQFFWIQTISIAVILTVLLSPLDAIFGESIVLMIKILLSLVIAILSSLGSLYNFNEIANHHHLVAHKYQTLWRYCKNYKTDFPDESLSDDALRVAKSYRDRINEINRDSPQIPDWAHKRVKEYLEGDMDKFDIEKELSFNDSAIKRVFFTAKDTHKKKSLYMVALKILNERISKINSKWAITGSFGLALQKISIEFNDIDVITTKEGAYQIEKQCREFLVKKVDLTNAVDIKSHYGTLEIKGVKIDIMGGVENNFDSPQNWVPRTDWENHLHYIEISDDKIPVLDLEYEHEIYTKLRDFEKVKIIKNKIDE